MKKIVCLLSLLVLLFSFPVISLAVPETDFESLEENVSDELFSSIDSDIKSILRDMGIEADNFSGVLDFSLDDISSFFNSTLADKTEICLKNILFLLSVILLCGSVSTLFADGKNDDFISLLSIVIVTLISVNIIKGSLTAACSVLKLSGNFMLSFIPIYTMVISLAGNAASALTYNTLLIAFAEFLSSVISFFSADFLGVFFCLSISFSMNESVNTGRFISGINKCVSIALGLLSGLFTGFLSIKNVLCASIDSVSVKGIRFLISSLIPVVGSSISDAYSSFIGSINLIKGSVAVVGILVVVIINLPIILETLIYYISFTVLSYISDSISANRAGEAIRCFACGVRILLLLCVFEMFILIISTGIMLSLKGVV